MLHDALNPLRQTPVLPPVVEQWHKSTVSIVILIQQPPLVDNTSISLLFALCITFTIYNYLRFGHNGLTVFG